MRERVGVKSAPASGEHSHGLTEVRLPVSAALLLFYLLKDSGKYATRRPMETLILLIGMVLILEGLPYVAAPESMQAWLKKISEIRPEQLRVMGLAAMTAGLLLCWIIKGDSLF